MWWDTSEVPIMISVAQSLIECCLLWSYVFYKYFTPCELNTEMLVFLNSRHTLYRILLIIMFIFIPLKEDRSSPCFFFEAAIMVAMLLNTTTHTLLGFSCNHRWWEKSQSRTSAIWGWTYIWATYLLKQLYLAEFRQVEANTKCDRDRLNCFISHVKLRLQEFTWYYFQWLFHFILFIYVIYSLCGLITGCRRRHKDSNWREDLKIYAPIMGQAYYSCCFILEMRFNWTGLNET